jgi:hypothetical protein
LQPKQFAKIEAAKVLITSASGLRSVVGIRSAIAVADLHFQLFAVTVFEIAADALY